MSAHVALALVAIVLAVVSLTLAATSIVMNPIVRDRARLRRRGNH